MSDKLSLMEQKIVEGIREEVEGREGDDHLKTLSYEDRIKDIAHRKANELWVEDEEIEEDAPIEKNSTMGKDIMNASMQEGMRRMRDRLFKPKNEE